MLWKRDRMGNPACLWQAHSALVPKKEKRGLFCDQGKMSWAFVFSTQRLKTSPRFLMLQAIGLREFIRYEEGNETSFLLLFYKPLFPHHSLAPFRVLCSNLQSKQPKITNSSAISSLWWQTCNLNLADPGVFPLAMWRCPCGGIGRRARFRF